LGKGSRAKRSFLCEKERKRSREKGMLLLAKTPTGSDERSMKISLEREKNPLID